MVTLVSDKGKILFEGDYKPAKDWAKFYVGTFTAQIGKRTYDYYEFMELRAMYVPVSKATLIKSLQTSNYTHYVSRHGYWDRFYDIKYDLVLFTVPGKGSKHKPRALFEWKDFYYTRKAYCLEIGDVVALNLPAKEIIDDLLTSALLKSLEKEANGG